MIEKLLSVFKLAARFRPLALASCRYEEPKEFVRLVGTRIFALLFRLLVALVKSRCQDANVCYKAHLNWEKRGTISQVSSESLLNGGIPHFSHRPVRPGERRLFYYGLSAAGSVCAGVNERGRGRLLLLASRLPDGSLRGSSGQTARLPTKGRFLGFILMSAASVLASDGGISISRRRH